MEKYYLSICRSIWDDQEKIYIEDLETDTEVAIKTEDEAIIVVFKPTNSENDTFYNFDFRLVSVPWMPSFAKAKVHNGFLTKLNRVSFDIDRTLRRLQEQMENASDKEAEDKPEAKVNTIVFTGFSQGGAMAQLAAHRFRSVHQSEGFQVTCFAFGCPRVGNSAFIKNYDKIVENSCRVYYGYDPIPSLPPRMFSYKDTKNPIWIQRDGQVSRKERPWWKSFYLLVEWKWKPNGSLQTDHGSKILYEAICQAQL